MKRVSLSGIVAGRRTSTEELDEGRITAEELVEGRKSVEELGDTDAEGDTLFGHEGTRRVTTNFTWKVMSL